MQRALIVMCLLLAGGAGLGLFVESKRAAQLARETATLRARLLATEQQVEEKTTALHALEAERKRLANDLEALQSKLQEQTAPAAEGAQPSVPAQPATPQHDPAAGLESSSPQFPSPSDEHATGCAPASSGPSEPPAGFERNHAAPNSMKMPASDPSGG